MSSAQFDRDFELGELLAAIPLARLKLALNASLGTHWRIVDAAGQLVLGPDTAPAGDATAAPLRVNIDVVGQLQAFGPAREQVAASAAWLELLLCGACSYRMAADLHVEAVNADYAALQRKHAALQESEARYRDLAAQLERRVEAQVATITRAQRQLYLSEKMASVGSLAAGMAHEINNPIGFIRSNASTSLTYVEKIGKVLAAFRAGNAGEAERAWRAADMDFLLEDFPILLTESINGADRVSRIVTNLKKYANVNYAESGAVDLGEAVRSVAGIVADQLRQEIVLELDLQPVPHIMGDQGRINQMLLSIIQNAVHAIPGPGRIRVSMWQEGSEARIAVNDDGCGMAPDILSRIFDPFFTTRDVGKGMGLGLTVSHDIATAHGGRIEVESAPGMGSTFTIVLPLASKAAAGLAP